VFRGSNIFSSRIIFSWGGGKGEEKGPPYCVVTVALVKMYMKKGGKERRVQVFSTVVRCVGDLISITRGL